MQNRIEDIRKEIAITDVEGLMPKNHLLRKAEKAIDWNKIYDILEPYYCKDNGRPLVMLSNTALQPKLLKKYSP